MNPETSMPEAIRQLGAETPSMHSRVAPSTAMPAGVNPGEIYFEISVA